MDQIFTGLCIIAVAVFMFAMTFREGVTGDIELARAFLPLGALFGFFVIWRGLRFHKRSRSLRIEERNGVTVYTWTEFDGTQRRSYRDPQDEWKAASGLYDD